MKELFEKYMRECPAVAILRGITPAEVPEICDRLFAAGIRLLEILRSEVRQFEYGERANHFDRLMGTDRFRLGEETADEFLERGRAESAGFRSSVRDILLY